MKNKLILSCALLFCLSNSYAQWKFSAIAGPQIANFGGKDKKDWGDTNSDPEMVVRFHAGFLAERIINENVSLVTGLQFSSKGARYSEDRQDFSTQKTVEVTYTKRLSYLDLPILLRYRKDEKWSFIFGPQVSFLLSAKIKNNDNAQRLDESPEIEDVKDNYTTIDVGLNIGPAYSINEKMMVQLLYQHGLLKIGKDQAYNNNGGFTDQKYAIMNRVLMLSLIYTFKQN